MPSVCDICKVPASWVRHTQFAGDHYFCLAHARAEKDFGADTDTVYWTTILIESTTQINIPAALTDAIERLTKHGSCCDYIHDVISILEVIRAEIHPVGEEQKEKAPRPIPGPSHLEAKATCSHEWEPHLWEPENEYCPYCGSTRPRAVRVGDTAVVVTEQEFHDTCRRAEAVVDVHVAVSPEAIDEQLKCLEGAIPWCPEED